MTRSEVTARSLTMSYTRKSLKGVFDTAPARIPVMYHTSSSTGVALCGIETLVSTRSQPISRPGPPKHEFDGIRFTWFKDDRPVSPAYQMRLIDTDINVENSALLCSPRIARSASFVCLILQVLNEARSKPS